MDREARAGDLVWAPWSSSGEKMRVLGVSGHGSDADVLVEVELEDEDGRVVDTMTMTYRSHELEVA